MSTQPYVRTHPQNPTYLPTDIPKEVLREANSRFDSKFRCFGNYIEEINPVNWIPVPPGFDRSMDNSQLDLLVVPWNGANGYRGMP